MYYYKCICIYYMYIVLCYKQYPKKEYIQRKKINNNNGNIIIIIHWRSLAFFWFIFFVTEGYEIICLSCIAKKKSVTYCTQGLYKYLNFYIKNDIKCLLHDGANFFKIFAVITQLFCGHKTFAVFKFYKIFKIFVKFCFYRGIVYQISYS